MIVIEVVLVETQRVYDRNWPREAQGMFKDEVRDVGPVTLVMSELGNHGVLIDLAADARGTIQRQIGGGVLAERVADADLKVRATPAQGDAETISAGGIGLGGLR